VSVILVIQPDAAQARVLNDMCRRIGAEMVDVDSTRRAVDAIARRVPDLILLSQFLSPRDEDTLMSQLRSLEGASHLQTMTIPQFRTGEESKSKKSGFGFRKKQKAAVAVGADPASFADEVVALLHRASEIRNRPAPVEPVRSVIAPAVEAEPEPERVSSLLINDAAESEPLFVNSLIDDSIFVDSADAAEPAAVEYAAEVAEPATIEEPVFEEPIFQEPDEQPAMAASVGSDANRTRSIAEEIDQLVRQLGLDVKLGGAKAPAPPAEVVSQNVQDDDFDLGASLERARNKAIVRTDELVLMHPDAEAIRESAMAEARAVAEREAREATAAEIARVQAEAQAVRVAAEARAAADREAREALAADLEQKRLAAEEKAAAERQAREALAADLERKRQAAEEKAAAERQAREALAADLERKRQAAEEKAAAERQAREALAAELERKRQAAEEKAAAERQAREALAADLERKRQAAEQKAAAEREAREALAADLERKRQAAEAQAAAERQAREALAADHERKQSEAEEKRKAAEARATLERQAREALAADLARAQAEAEQVREAAIAEARAAAEKEAREALAADLARVQVEAEQMRLRAMTEARETAEREARETLAAERETLAAEVERARSEAQSTFTDALNKVKGEAEESDRRRVEAERFNEEAKEAFARELLRVRHEVEQSLTAQLDAARAEAERIRAAEAEAVRERTAVEAQLKAELDRLRFVTTQARKADESETKKAAQQIKQLEAELATVRAKAEERKTNELEELRAQMAEMREAAAQHARAAAADAVAAAVAAAAPRPTAVITQFPTREVARAEPPHVDEPTSDRSSRDYLSLWQPKTPTHVDEPEEVSEVDEEPGESFVSAANMRRHAKWALPVAACLILVTNTGTAIDAVSKLLAREEKKPQAIVEPLPEQPPFIEMIERRVGKLELSSTPSGAEAIVDGKSYGKTPLTIPDLDVGLHTLQLKSESGTITRKVTIKNNQTTLLTEAIYSGWLAIFSQIPVKVVVDGVAVSLTEDGRVMASPGTHVVQFINEQFNYRVTEKLEVRPGETTAHTLTLPMGTVRVTAPEGTAILVDGQPAHGTPSEGLSVAIGSHEISARHPDLGERRMPIDVKHGGLTEVTLRFE
jgi:hypothetical protein